MSRDTRDRGRLHWRRPGSFFRLDTLGTVVATVVVLGACTRDGTSRRDVVQLETGEVQLPEGSRRHDVALEGVGAQGEVTPATVEARVGDAVAFTASDAITHSVAFLGDRLDSAQVAFLESRGQLRGPPLLTAGSSWVVTLDGAPPGDYPFACTLHGGQGVVRVAPRD